ncbi:serine hydrolase [Phenylobacterium sp.]|uniref:serine hydrolase n=1 Tax=Phenylobacterium sp. TaxID=1871053 RepID=UPI00391ADA0F
MRGAAVIAVVAASLAAGPVGAGTIFADDFQSGKAPAWRAGGAGDVGLSTYQDNVSLKVSGGAFAQASVDATGFERVWVGARLAGLGLRRDDACLAEVSADQGASWRPVLAIGAERADGETLHRGGYGDRELDGRPLLIRIRAAGAPGALCWADDIQVEGDRPTPLERDLAAPGYRSPYAGDALLPPPGARPPSRAIAGRLSVSFDRKPDGFRLIRDDLRLAGVDALRAGAPALAVTLAQDGERVFAVPAEPDWSDGRAWNWTVGSGRAWRDASGRDVAVLPVALGARNANCIHNGHLVLGFDAAGAVESARAQIGGETCKYLKFDAWWTGVGRLRPAGFSETADALAADRANRAARLPTRPLADLAHRAPDLDPRWLSQASGDREAVFGLVVDGVNYAAPCDTRFGDDPYCDERTLPSYSVAKSLVGGFGLMRMERLAPGTKDLTVGELVPECAGHGWDDVPVLALLDMASGHYLSAAYEADEDDPRTVPFFDAETRADKLAFACRHFPRREPPGRTWVYRTSDTFLLGEALTRALRRQRPAADLYDDVLAPIWSGLGLSADMGRTRRTLDAERTPLTGFGLTLLRDDAARLGQFLAPGRREAPEALLSKPLLDAALQRDGGGAGLPVGIPGFRYSHGFWARDVAKVVGCPAPVWTPFMSGFGGISIVVFPNDVVFYAFSDEGRFDWGAAAKAAHAIKGLCQ